MLTIYGIKNCDTMKKAFNWLDEHQIKYQFHNYKTDGLSAEILQNFMDKLGWQTILNTRGTTWRKLDEAFRQSIDNADAAKQLMLEQTSIIKRPILIAGGKALAGFSPELYQQFFEN
ncbi:Spx/MgsR family transcriptional regulator [Orbus hercynius]|uniref:Spx/MgsR family transcriptional regulator n=1 Tax=Orbus hercynius TaxID=593135 RepID=A0A495RII4_9GAMM|nr:ArsC family reductase [Orbus hercynius]RKS87120.1 Spx/MgsR family transcriptional regulator [Orbus hercynius]